MNKQKGTISLVIIILLVLIIIGGGIYFVFNRQSTGIIVVEERGEFTAREAGAGIGPLALCPEGRKVISGGCVSSSAPTKFILFGQESTKTNDRFDYNNAWACSFTATEPGTFVYQVQANCQ
jgi:hypothetical protein